MRNPALPDRARISEIFSSLQGEGPWIGCKHLFVRFEECHIHCQYCDELDKPAKWMSIDEVVSILNELNDKEVPHTHVSLTGGEPLIYLPFLKPLMLRLRDLNYRTYLETDGILSKPLGDVLDLCDVIAMDLKPASVTGEKSFLEDHRRFLQVAKHKDVFIKMVLSKSIDEKEFLELVSMTADIHPDVTFVLQPLSDQIEGHDDPVLMKKLYDLQKLAARKLRRVSIVPRLHKILKLR